MKFFEKQPTNHETTYWHNGAPLSFDHVPTDDELAKAIKELETDNQPEYEQDAPQLSKRQEALTRMADERGITLPEWFNLLDRPDVSELPNIYSVQQQQIENQLMNQFSRYVFLDNDTFLDAVASKKVDYSNPGEYEEAIVSSFGPVRSKSFTVGMKFETDDGPDYQELEMRRLELILGHDDAASMVDTRNLYMVKDVKKQMKAIFDEIAPTPASVALETATPSLTTIDVQALMQGVVQTVLEHGRGQVQPQQVESSEDKPEAMTFQMPRVLRRPNLHLPKNLSRTKVLGASGVAAALAIGWHVTGDDAPEMSPEASELSAALYENEAVLPPHTFTANGKAYVGTQIKDGWLPQGTPEEAPGELDPYVENYTMSFDDGKWGIDFEATNGAFTVAPDGGKHLVTIDPEKFETVVTDLQTESDAKSSVVKEAASITNEEVATLQKYVSDNDGKIYDTFDAKDIVSANQAMGKMTAEDVNALGESAVLSQIEQQFGEDLTEDFQNDVEQYVYIVGEKLNISPDDITVEIKDDGNLSVSENPSDEPITSGTYRLSGADAINIKEQSNE